MSQSPSKLAILKLGEGDLTSGLSVILQIGDDQARPDIERLGQLPPNPRLLEALLRWETQYQNLDFQGRPLGKPGQVASPTSRREDCQAAAQTLATELNQWLQEEGFRPLREKWLSSLPSATNLRVSSRPPIARSKSFPGTNGTSCKPTPEPNWASPPPATIAPPPPNDPNARSTSSPSSATARALTSPRTRPSSRPSPMQR
ncbi:MAG: hypothetical protein HC860_21775 [Alkalinema sp. RU_4_3]|nr:hypothetical protein [Alkalinema sp. RU_4_3]